MQFIAANWLLIAAIIAVLGLIVWSHNADMLGGFRNVGTAEAVQQINRSGARIVDLRPAAEFQEGHISGAINLPQGDLASGVASHTWSKDEPVLLVCGAGQRPTGAVKQLKGAGAAQIYNLQGGIRAWQDANLPLTRAEESSS